MEKILPRMQAVFGQGNINRIRKIAEARNNENKLSLISPSFIVADLTWKCNYCCGACIDGNVVNKSNGELSLELIEDIFDYSKKSGVRGIMTMGGEVFLYENGIKKALKKSIECQIPVKTVTNGSLLDNFIPEIVEAYKIPGSMLRISINSDKEHYQKQTGQNHTKLEDVLDSIKRVTSKGTPVYVSTIVFPESARKTAQCGKQITPNIYLLENIIKDCEATGIKTQILIPARDPQTRKRYPRNDNERTFMANLVKNEFKHELEAGEFTYKKKNEGMQNLDFNPCPSGFIFTLIGSDGKIYKCTDNRGKDSAVLGKIEKPGDFERFWHSEERIKAQKYTKCANEGCTRYKINCMLDSTIKNYGKNGSQGDFLEFFEQEGGGRDYIWI